MHIHKFQLLKIFNFTIIGRETLLRKVFLLLLPRRFLLLLTLVMGMVRLAVALVTLLVLPTLYQFYYTFV